MVYDYEGWLFLLTKGLYLRKITQKKWKIFRQTAYKVLKTIILILFLIPRPPFRLGGQPLNHPTTTQLVSGGTPKLFEKWKRCAGTLFWKLLMCIKRFMILTTLRFFCHFLS